jgi:thiamine pyrophosphate-dependent acetolactate synthase large subunit-like protein
MATTTGHRKLLEQLQADGMTTMFGNPGSSEEGLLAEISRSEIRYILGLQEAAVVLMASGYAQATQKPTAVQLHCSVGLGNAIGSLYQAFRMQRAPLVVIVGEAGIAADALDAHMALDLVTLARPVTKYAARVIHPGSLLRLVRRCVKVAATPPVGPVFLSVPQDILDQPNEEPVLPTVFPETRVMPEPALIARAAEMLAGAENPVIIMGDGVAHSQAQGELARLAQVLGAGVWGAMASQLNISWMDPLYRGSTGHMFGEVDDEIALADAVLICGTYVFPDVFPALHNPFRPDAKVIHIDLDAYNIAKNHPVKLGLVSDPKPTLRLLAEAIADGLSPGQRQAAHDRAERLAQKKQQQHARDHEANGAHRTAVPLHMSAFAEELAKQLPMDAIVYDESLTYSEELMRSRQPTTPGGFFQTPGGTLGVGIPGAVGVKLAHPDRTVVGFTGDGGAMFTYQALWTAAHEGIGAKFVVCNNTSYRILKRNIVEYWRTSKQPPDQPFPPSFDVSEPNIDFVSLAHGLGVPGCRVSEPAQIAGAITTMLDNDMPYLIELKLERHVDAWHRDEGNR